MDYAKILSESVYRLCGIEREFGVSSTQMCGYIYRGVQPIKNKEKIDKIMEHISKSPRMVKHPSFGYATEDEIKKLQTMGHCPDRDLILKAIEKRTATKGKGVK